MSAATTEDFQKARQDRDTEANQNSNAEPIQLRRVGTRFFMGYGKSDSISQFWQYCSNQH